MNVAKILSVVFARDTRDKWDTSGKALEDNHYSHLSPVPQVSQSEIPSGTNSKPSWDNENHNDQRVTGMCPTVPDVPRIFAVVSKGRFTPDELDALEERAAIIHEAHTIATGDDGKPLPEPIFTITHQQAERMALAETETET